MEHLNDKGEVYSYNNNQYKRTPFAVQKGDKIEWKRNGSRGGVNAVVLGFSESRPAYVFVENWLPDWSRTYFNRARVWIKKNSVLRVITPTNFGFIAPPADHPVVFDNIKFKPHDNSK